MNTDINILKKELHFVQQIEDNAWKIDLVKELTEVKQNEMTVMFNNDKMTHSEIEHLIRLVTTE